ncbi:MAG: hypothetical protein RJA57_899 [Bacteroidota bacterium]
MKKALYLLLLTGIAVAADAQNYDNIKNMLVLGQLPKAKEEVDKNMGNAKFTSKPEAYMLKATVYASMIMNDALKGTAENALKLAAEADAAFGKYRELDGAIPLIKDPVYQNAPINLYSFYYSNGYQDYTKKKWEEGFGKLERAVVYSDLLIANKIITAPIDTNVLILAGITAESSKKSDEAANYYGRLADARIPGEDYESVYRFLVNHYFTRKDMSRFEKYKNIGKDLYPKSEYFTYDKVDFAIGLVDGFHEKIKAVEEILATDPDNFKANQIMGEIIFDTLDSYREGAVMPANYNELETKMIAGFRKAAASKPDYEIPYLFMGDHYIGKAIKLNDARSVHAAEMKARTKPGTMASKDDIAKRDLLDKQYGDALEVAREPYEKAAAIFASKSSLELRDKQQYKKVANYLADIFSYKKIQARNKKDLAGAAKFEAEEKKWNDRYETIK